MVRQHDISIHALREEGDTRTSRISSSMPSFLSTPSARRATLLVHPVYRTGRISIHALREEGDDFDNNKIYVSKISIHALREEGDPAVPATRSASSYFYPRPPRGGRHTAPNNGAESRHFYPRPPRGGRRAAQRRRMERIAFLSTPSARRATANATARDLTDGISIHALREEGDCFASHSVFLL